MSSSIETGHAKTVANFEKLIDYCEGYGTIYNPSKTTISLASLKTLHNKAKEVLTEVNSNFPSYSNAIAAREIVFAPLSKLATKVINALKATDTSDQVIDNARTIIRKLQGRRASAKTKQAEVPTVENPEEIKIVLPIEPKEISASQMSFDSRIENLDKLIKLISSVPEYAPNEEELKISSLTTLYNDLRAKNTAVMQAVVPISNARITRNEILYKEKTGLVDVALDVRAYVKSIFGATSPQFKQISKLSFRKEK